VWIFNGITRFVEAFGAAAGLSPVVAKRAVENAQVRHVGSVLRGLSTSSFERFKKYGGQPPAYLPNELAQIRQALEVAELDVSELHLLAAAGEYFLAEAWAAFGLERKTARLSVALMPSSPPPPAADPAELVSVPVGLGAALPPLPPPAAGVEPAAEPPPKPPRGKRNS
jgi:hypothetical protein